LGHRGARRYAPENTFEAFELALDHGCDGFEFDVRCTSDHRLVIWHDATLKRVSIARAAYPELCDRLQGRRRSLGEVRGGQPQLACLEEVLATYAQRAYLDIEVKIAGAEPEIAQAVAANPPQRGYVVSSFLPEVVQKMRSLNPRLNLGCVVRDRRLLRHWRNQDVQVVIAHYSLMSRELVEAVHETGRKVFVWTVNRPRLMRELAEWGVDAIISDDTRLLSATLKAQSAAAVSQNF
jgi:glycerophosphoryl diester phosphodiesterase